MASVRGAGSQATQRSVAPGSGPSSGRWWARWCRAVPESFGMAPHRQGPTGRGTHPAGSVRDCVICSSSSRSSAVSTSALAFRGRAGSVRRRLCYRGCEKFRHQGVVRAAEDRAVGSAGCLLAHVLFNTAAESSEAPPPTPYCRRGSHSCTRECMGRSGRASIRDNLIRIP